MIIAPMFNPLLPAKVKLGPPCGVRDKKMSVTFLLIPARSGSPTINLSERRWQEARR